MLELAPEACRRVTAIILDVDGVLTDGRITFTDQGAESKSFHVRDGTGLKLWHRAGRASAILSGRHSTVIRRRARELGIDVIETGARDKLPALRRILANLGVDGASCAYLGDDLPDLPVMRAVGLPLAVADASVDVKEHALGVTEARGGHGAVREVVEYLLRAQEAWGLLLQRYLGPESPS